MSEFTQVKCPRCGEGVFGECDIGTVALKCPACRRRFLWNSRREIVRDTQSRKRLRGHLLPLVLAPCVLVVVCYAALRQSRGKPSDIPPSLGMSVRGRGPARNTHSLSDEPARSPPNGSGQVEVVASAADDPISGSNEETPPTCLLEEEYLGLPEEDIDIAEGALIIASGFHPDLDKERHLRRVDEMAHALRGLLQDVREPSRIVAVISEYVFGHQGVEFTEADERRHFLSDVLDHKHGSCAAISCLYLALATRLGLPFCGVLAPKHTFVRCQVGDVRVNIEVTDKGRQWTDDLYVAVDKIPRSAIDRGAYLRGLTKKQFLAHLLANRGALFYRQGAIDRAIADSSVAISINPRHAEAYFNRGLAYRAKREYEKQISDLTTAVSLNPNLSEAYVVRADAYQATAQYEMSVQDCTVAIRLNPALLGAYMRRGSSLMELGRMQEAVNSFSEGISISPEDSPAHCNRAIAYCFMKKHDDALRDINKAVELDSDRGENYAVRGEVLAEMGREAKAERDFTKALALSPNLVLAYAGRARVYGRRGEYGMAVRDFSAAVSLDPSNPVHSYNRALMYSALGDKSNMIKDLKKAVSLRPSMQEALRFDQQFRKWGEDDDFRALLR